MSKKIAKPSQKEIEAVMGGTLETTYPYKEMIRWDKIYHPDTVFYVVADNDDTLFYVRDEDLLHVTGGVIFSFLEEEQAMMYRDVVEEMLEYQTQCWVTQLSYAELCKSMLSIEKNTQHTWRVELHDYDIVKEKLDRIDILWDTVKYD